MTREPDALPVLNGNSSGRPPSIFNDVIGPVMRGPSSSHCAAAVRIGRLARDLMAGDIQEILVEFHPDGSLATTHRSQGSDMGLFGGLLGWDADHEDLVESEAALAEAGIRVTIQITEFPAFHPNTYRMTLSGQNAAHRMTALSTGGGIIKVTEIDGFRLELMGDLHETLLFFASTRGAFVPGEATVSRLSELHGVYAVKSFTAPPDGLEDSRWNMMVQVTGSRCLVEGELLTLLGEAGPDEIRCLEPVLPVGLPVGATVPFLSEKELRRAQGGQDKALWELAVLYESKRGGLGAEEVLERMEDIVRIMERSVQEGLAGTEYHDRILPPQTLRFAGSLERGELLDLGLLNTITLNVSAIMEVKSSMGVVVAAPTAGACGALAATVIGAGQALGASRADMARALLAAGLVGVFIAAGSTFAAEVCGCQAETGAGSGMAAAALVTLLGGSTDQALGAASMALQNTMGMICDPVANRVEVPCLGRNVLAGANAVTSANLSVAGFDPVIPLDEVIKTMDDVGKSLPHQLRCTALGGLSVTPTSRAIEERLKG